ncbi:amidohydrolase [Actinocorallia sp. B10E7]|uniref:amidohydrolase family protein n=1 Tax=Actinocorallia sp. B10E7 TaxID=3153558 RepID=UPI00325F5998
MSGKTLIRGAHVLTAGPAGALRDAAVLVEGSTITAVGPYAELKAAHPDAAELGGPHDLVLPGFVNTHGHFSEGLITGLAEGFTLWEWLHALIDPVAPHLNRASAYMGTMLSGIQMLRSGITTANDMFCSDPGADEPLTPGVVAALDELNLRGVVSFGAGDIPVGSVTAQLEEHAALLESAEASRLSTFRVGVGAIGGQSEELFAASVELAVGGGHGVHIHLQEVREEVTATFQRYGATPIAHCAREGLFAAPTLAAHCVWVDRHDRRLLADHRVGVAHNPVSNMILASGAAPVMEMRALGVNVGIGVDGAASNDSQDMLQAIKSAALLARVHAMQATAMTAREAFEMATIGGARALEMDDVIGSLEVGKAADVVVLDGSSPTLANIHDPYQAVVYVAGSREVKDVLVDGRPSVADGEVVTVDAAEIAERSRPMARDLVRRAGLAHLSELAR